MPYLGSGVDQHVNTTVVPAWVFSPNPVGGATLRLYNEGTQLVFVGGANVTPFNGLPIYPNAKPVELQNISGTVYTCSNSFVGANTAAATMGTTTGIGTVGTTKLTVTTINTFMTGGVTLQLGTGSNTEFVVIASTATTVVTLSNPTLYYHPVGDVMTIATTTIGQLRVTAGVL
jgi:hypothetical protein